MKKITTPKEPKPVDTKSINEIGAWEEVEVDINKLIPYDKNPRLITPEAKARLLADLKEFGYHKRIIANRNFHVAGGHQKLSIFKEAGAKKLRVLMPPRMLTYDEFQHIVLADNAEWLYGQNDPERLKGFKVDTLQRWGVNPASLEATKPSDDKDEKAVSFSVKKKEIECPNCKHKFKK